MYILLSSCVIETFSKIFTAFGSRRFCIRIFSSTENSVRVQFGTTKIACYHVHPNYLNYSNHTESISFGVHCYHNNILNTPSAAMMYNSVFSVFHWPIKVYRFCFLVDDRTSVLVRTQPLGTQYDNINH